MGQDRRTNSLIVDVFAAFLRFDSPRHSHGRFFVNQPSSTLAGRTSSTLAGRTRTLYGSQRKPWRVCNCRGELAKHANKINDNSSKHTVYSSMLSSF